MKALNTRSFFGRGAEETQASTNTATALSQISQLPSNALNISNDSSSLTTSERSIPHQNLDELNERVDVDSQAFYLQDDVELRGNEKRYTPLNPPPVDRNMAPFLRRKKPKGPDLAPNLNRLIQQERMDNEQLGYNNEAGRNALFPGGLDPSFFLPGSSPFGGRSLTNKASHRHRDQVNLSEERPFHEVGEQFEQEIEFGEQNTAIDYASGTPLEHKFVIDDFGDPRIGLDPLFVRIIKQVFPKPMPVQKRAIPCVLTGQQLMCETPTGSGKTAAYLIPAIQIALQAKRTNNYSSPYVLIIGNTNNLMEQIYNVAKTLIQYDSIMEASPLGIRLLPCFSSAGSGRIPSYDGKSEICICTTGRLLPSVDNKSINLADVRLVVLDEADKMVNNDFGEAIVKLHKLILEQKKVANPHVHCLRDGDPRLHYQIASFTATLERHDNFIYFNQYLQEIYRQKVPTHIFMTANSLIEQRVVKLMTPNTRSLLHYAFWQRKFLLQQLLDQDLQRQEADKDDEYFDKRTVVFVETRKGCIFWCTYLVLKGYKFNMISGDLPHEMVHRILADLREGRIQGVVTTNKMARGMDIQGIEHVSYCSFTVLGSTNVIPLLIGRTGRIGHRGRSTVIFGQFVDAKHAKPLLKCLSDRKQKIPRWLFDMVVAGAKFQKDMSIQMQPMETLQNAEFERQYVEETVQDSGAQADEPVEQLDSFDPYDPANFEEKIAPPFYDEDGTINSYW
ncbi:hypothetical protein WR25_05595 [Diploscapter pachys]|uniref:RNA helicase n=1 Tax=Diploscapter pachys TaxID=2018661 RepID=A0A2A2LTK1_9BILA|nr:hypothetical protein WR25_05595 [Diploscapter pachys]